MDSLAWQIVDSRVFILGGYVLTHADEIIIRCYHQAYCLIYLHHQHYIIMKQNAFEIAKEYALKVGKDCIRTAGEKDGYKYFHIYSKATIGHKIGIYQFVKISSAGEVTEVCDFQETMWASHQEVVLNNL